MNAQKQKQRIYELMLGSWNLEDYPIEEGQYVENEFMEGKFCEQAYAGIYDANRRICQKLGVEDDPDVELIIGNCFGIMNHMCMKMFDYGALFSTK